MSGEDSTFRWHPDRFPSMGNSRFVEEANKKFQAIQEVYSGSGTCDIFWSNVKDTNTKLLEGKPKETYWLIHKERLLLLESNTE